MYTVATQSASVFSASPVSTCLRLVIILQQMSALPRQAAVLLSSKRDLTSGTADSLQTEGRSPHRCGRRRGIRTKPYDGIAGRAQWERLSRAITAARLQVPIAAEFALAEAARAHERLAQGHILGKIVLRISQ